jgi:transposase
VEQYSRESVRAFNATLVEAYWGGESVADIAKRSGRSLSTINKLVALDKHENGPRERTAKPRDPRIILEKKTISNRHGWIGLQLSQYRSRNNLTTTALGGLLSVSRVQISNMELGSHDFTLSELDRISALTNVPLERLMFGATSIFQEGRTAAA